MSILSAQRLRECQGFIDKVGEIRFTKVKQRQLNKFNNLLNKKEGNITNSPQNLASQAGRQAGAHLSPKEGSNLMAQATQSGRQELTFPLGKEAVYLRQASAHLPSGEGGNVSQAGSQAGAHLPLGEGGSLSQAGRQAITFPLGREAGYLRQAVRPLRQLHLNLVLTFPLGKEAT